MPNPKKANPASAIEQVIAGAVSQTAGDTRLSTGGFTGSTTFTAAGYGEVIDLTRAPCSKFSIQVIDDPVGGVTVWSIFLSLSITGDTTESDDEWWDPIGLQHTNAIQSTGVILSVANIPAAYLRIHCLQLALGGGTSATAHWTAIP